MGKTGVPGLIGFLLTLSALSYLMYISMAHLSIMVPMLVVNMTSIVGASQKRPIKVLPWPVRGLPSSTLTGCLQARASSKHYSFVRPKRKILFLSSIQLIGLAADKTC